MVATKLQGYTMAVLAYDHQMDSMAMMITKHYKSFKTVVASEHQWDFQTIGPT